MKKMPLCLQKDSMQCGIACLQMVCKYFGREYSMDSLSKLSTMCSSLEPESLCGSIQGEEWEGILYCRPWEGIGNIQP